MNEKEEQKTASTRGYKWDSTYDGRYFWVVPYTGGPTESERRR